METATGSYDGNKLLGCGSLGEGAFKSMKGTSATDAADTDKTDDDTPSMSPSVSGSKELASVQCRLETKDLWDKFHELGTEMIITKSGR